MKNKKKYIFISIIWLFVIIIYIYYRNNKISYLENYYNFLYNNLTIIQKNSIESSLPLYFSWYELQIVENLNETKIEYFIKNHIPVFINYWSWNNNLISIFWFNNNKYIVYSSNSIIKNIYLEKDLVLKILNNNWNWWLIFSKLSTNSYIDLDREQNNNNLSAFMSKSFYNNLILNKNSWNSIQLSKNVYWWIVSHHLFVAPYFEDYYRNLQKYKPDIHTFIIIWTNHFNTWDNIYSTQVSYETPFWQLDINKLLISKYKGIVYNDDLFKIEHSINTQVGFIKKFFPNAKIIPLLVNDYIDNIKNEQLVESIFQNRDENQFLLQSTDFTHYQPQYIANYYDLYSQQIINDFKFDKIKNSFIDCRNCLTITLNVMKKLWAYKNNILKYSSSNLFLNIENLENTSYFFSYFTQWTNNNKSNWISMMFLWDLILNYDTNNSIKNYPFDLIDWIENTFFRWYDKIIMNIEWTFWNKTISKQIASNKILFQYNKNWIQILKNYLKTDVLFFSNNHLNDFNQKNILNTKKILHENNIQFVWSFSWFNITWNLYKFNEWNKTINIINLNDVNYWLNDSSINDVKSYIKSLEKNKNIIIIYIHRWLEYHNKPSQRQKQIAHELIDNWVDLIIGTHPHVIQPKELYNWKYIYYSLWNVTFDSINMPVYYDDVLYWIMLGVNINDWWVLFSEIPYKIINRQPKILINEEKINVLNKLDSF